MTTYAHVFRAPVGEMFLAVNEVGEVTRLEFLNGRAIDEYVERISGNIEWSESRCSAAQVEVEAYFRGEIAEFSLPIAPQGSEFQHAVWREVQKIPFGSTASYGEVAERLGRPGASRAVGRANATNPVVLITPCHRVIGADGSLTGFGGGVDRKKALLELESGARQEGLPGLAQ